jgi:hypothetical protein
MVSIFEMIQWCFSKVGTKINDFFPFNIIEVTMLLFFLLFMRVLPSYLAPCFANDMCNKLYAIMVWWHVLLMTEFAICFVSAQYVISELWSNMWVN